MFLHGHFELVGCSDTFSVPIAVAACRQGDAFKPFGANQKYHRLINRAKKKSLNIMFVCLLVIFENIPLHRQNHGHFFKILDSKTFFFYFTFRQEIETIQFLANQFTDAAMCSGR